MNAKRSHASPRTLDPSVSARLAFIQGADQSAFRLMTLPIFVDSLRSFPLGCRGI
jgi:hypothetical protein